VSKTQRAPDIADEEERKREVQDKHNDLCQQLKCHALIVPIEGAVIAIGV
jgi:hypothetical protein